MRYVLEWSNHRPFQGEEFLEVEIEGDGVRFKIAVEDLYRLLADHHRSPNISEIEENEHG